MRCKRTAMLLASSFVFGCAGNPDRQTLARLRSVEPDVTDVQIEDGLGQAMEGYRDFLEQAPKSALTPEAMRRLADLQLEREFGILAGSAPVPKTATAAHGAQSQSSGTSVPASIATDSESEQDFETRAASAIGIEPSGERVDLELPDQSQVEWAGSEEAIKLYDKILAAYPNYAHNDQVLYQKARAYDELGKTDEAIAVIEGMIVRYPDSSYIDEVQFRRGEYFFTRRKYYEAELAYAAAVAVGTTSPYYELALYKLGWSLYKQEFHEEALHRYIALLDFKVAKGYDFEQASDETEERRIADTYRVISLSLSSLGGAQAVDEYFAANGHRSYEDRIYSHLGEFYLEKLRYNDAAAAYRSFIEIYPLHATSPRFGMRVVEIYEAGGFPKLVLESKKDFAVRYALTSDYWTQVDAESAPDVVGYLKTNLEDLATHFHAAFQEKKLAEVRPANFEEAQHWYREYLTSFADDARTPAIHYQLADLLLENRDFSDAALEYERTAYAYSEHEQAAAAGYAAIFAHRENQKAAPAELREVTRGEAVASTLRFVGRFPGHEHAAVVLGAAVDDLYDMKKFEEAITTGRQLVEGYPQADPAVLRSAWAAVAHSHFDTQDFVQAEGAYAHVLEMIEPDDESRPAVVENLAAAIYKQGEQANAAEDYRLAADHFLRIPELAPRSAIRPVAEYDAGTALIQLQDWDAAAAVLETYRESHPEHELLREATKQIAFIYRSAGKSARAAEEFERVAREADEPELRREALLLAATLYEESKMLDQALAVYLGYVQQFPEPLETVVEMRFKVAELYEATGDEEHREEQLRKIVAIHEGAGAESSDAIRHFAARSAFALTVDYYHRFDAVKLVQPFDTNLASKKKRMDEALAAFEKLIDYEDSEATAGATYYIAEIYFEFSRALLESERPSDLSDGELVEYELVLEEEAYPFEEQAIEVHEKNLELMTVGVYNTWVDKSFLKLADLMPGRYAKFEESSGPVGSIEEYAYRSPSRPAEGAQGSELPEAEALGGDEVSSELPAASESAQTSSETETETAAAG